MSVEANEKARRARALLNDPFFREVLQALKEESLESVVNSLPEEADLREEAYRDLRALDRLREQLKSYSIDVKIAKIRSGG
jgi:hypothetical protein